MAFEWLEECKTVFEQADVIQALVSQFVVVEDASRLDNDADEENPLGGRRNIMIKLNICNSNGTGKKQRRTAESTRCHLMKP